MGTLAPAGRAVAALAGLLLTMACFGAVDDAGSPPAPRTFGDSIGLVVKFVQRQPLSELNTLTELKVRWVREIVSWTAIEPEPGRFVDFPPVLKRELEFYRRNNIGLVALLDLGNGRAYPASATDPRKPYDTAAFGRYAARVARMLKAEGVRFVIELGNEPHNSEFAKVFGGTWNGKPPSPWVDQYAAMAREAVRQVKAVDPSIKLLTDDDMWIVHYWFLEAGLPPALDGFAVHPYTELPEVAAVAHDTDWTHPFQVVDRDRSFGSAVRRLRDAGRSKLGRTPQIWITEWGWPVAPGPFDKFVSEDTLAGYLPRTYILAAAAGVEVLCWFSAQDSVDGPMGLSDNQGRRRKSFHAFKTMSEELGSYRFVRQIVGADRPTKGLQAFLFQGKHDRKIAMWRADGPASQVQLFGTAAIDALGRTFPARSTTPPDTAIAQAVGALPIYVTGNWTDEFIDNFAKTIK